MTTTTLLRAALPAALLLGCSREEPPRYVLDADTGITLREGFDAELLYEVPPEQGSWVAMAFDPKGRLVVSDQDDKGVFRVTLPTGAGPVAVEPLPGFPFEPVAWGRRTVAGALGFLFAFDSLYMSTMKGFYRVRDTDGDDRFDEFTLLKRLHPGWEHSAHSIVRTEDGTGLYLISGNHSRLPDGVKTLHPPVWAEDSLLPSIPDPSGHARGIGPPGGWICRVSPDGADWTLVASGLRNAVDLAINREGELFTCDSDLEFDIGSPWYRPTRVNHVTSASEFGWRAGSAKWPEHYADSNGSVLDLGPGSPTGIAFGYDSAFPAELQDDLFVCDWTFGTIWTVALEEHGASYRGSKVEFLHGEPLNIAAMRFGPDGNMYFVTGGRNTASKLYRVRYPGAARRGSERRLAANQPLRDLRRALERHHRARIGPSDADAVAGAAAVTAAWPHLAHDDRTIRHAARLAIECQDVALWQERCLAERDPRTLAHAVIALCRHGDRALSGRVLAALDGVAFGACGRDDRLALLRAWSLCLLRLDDPGDEARARLAAKLLPFYPSGDDTLDAELCRLLCRLDAPEVVERTLALMDRTTADGLAYDAAMLRRHEYGAPILKALANAPNSRNIHFAYCLRVVQRGWTLERRKRYFGWLAETLQRSGGQSFEGYVHAIRDQAIANLPAADVAAVAWLLDDVVPVDRPPPPVPAGPGENWTTDRVMALLDAELTGRDHENGRRMFEAGRCAMCHRFQGVGGRCGPDLGAVGRRFTIRDIVASICDPNETIAEQFQASVVTRKSGATVHGRVIVQDERELVIAANPYDFADLTRVPADDVGAVELSPRSMMPPGTIASMNADEVRDLIAWLVSGGDPKHRVFAPK